MTSRAHTLVVSAIIVVTLSAPGHSALMLGHTIGASHLRQVTPDMTRVFGPIDAVVDSGVEYVAFGWDSLFDIDLSDTRIVIRLNAAQPAAVAELLAFTDANGTIADFTAVTLNSATTYAGFTASRIGVNSNSISLNLSGLSGLPGQQIVLNVTGAGATMPPGAPEGLGAIVSGFTARISWTPSMAGGAATGYVIEARLASEETIVAITTTAPSYEATGVPPGRYHLRVRAFNSFGVSPPSAEFVMVVNQDGSGVPLPPQALTAVLDARRVTLTWADHPVWRNPHQLRHRSGHGDDAFESRLSSGSTAIDRCGVGRRWRVLHPRPRAQRVTGQLTIAGGHDRGWQRTRATSGAAEFVACGCRFDRHPHVVAAGLRYRDQLHRGGRDGQRPGGPGQVEHRRCRRERNGQQRPARNVLRARAGHEYSRSERGVE